MSRKDCQIALKRTASDGELARAEVDIVLGFAKEQIKRNLRNAREEQPAFYNTYGEGDSDFVTVIKSNGVERKYIGGSL